jgi:hypothetical protein
MGRMEGRGKRGRREWGVRQKEGWKERGRRRRDTIHSPPDTIHRTPHTAHRTPHTVDLLVTVDDDVCEVPHSTRRRCVRSGWVFRDDKNTETKLVSCGDRAGQGSMAGTGAGRCVCVCENICNWHETMH